MTDAAAPRGACRRLRAAAKALRRELAYYRRLLAHPRTPWLAKVLLGLAVAYALTPVDLIPDFIPVLGHLDDFVIVSALVWLAVKFIPPAVRAEARKG